MYQFQEGDGEEDRKPGGRTLVKYICKVFGLKEEGAVENDIQYHSGDPVWWEKLEQKKKLETMTQYRKSTISPASVGPTYTYITGMLLLADTTFHWIWGLQCTSRTKYNYN